MGRARNIIINIRNNYKFNKRSLGVRSGGQTKQALSAEKRKKIDDCHHHSTRENEEEAEEEVVMETNQQRTQEIWRRGSDVHAQEGIASRKAGEVGKGFYLLKKEGGYGPQMNRSDPPNGEFSSNDSLWRRLNSAS